MTADMDLLDKKLASLTEQIFVEIGAPAELAGDERLRAAAVSRIETCSAVSSPMKCMRR